MPKMKTRRAAAKRFSMTASGKAKIKKANLRHILEKRSSKSKRHARKAGIASPSDMGRINRMVPYGN
jgi:large subunit ribosomal protein L35